ncbi:MAG: HigA family addiction module antitoxin [Ignavibacterium sp.]|nr:HigA family addiction module antitoxin [Ignavibacterium sp.]
MDKNLSNIHPGEILLEDFMKPLGISQYRLAKDIGVAPIRISQIVHGRRAISVDTAMRLARYFGTSAAYDGRDLYLDYDFDPDKYGDNDKLPAELRTDNFNLPTLFRAGVSYWFDFGEDYKLLLAADAVHPNDNDQYLNLGAEFNLLKIFAIRAGYRNIFMPEVEGGLVLGGGVQTNFNETNNIRFDYAYADYGRLAETHRITLSVGFK